MVKQQGPSPFVQDSPPAPIPQNNHSAMFQPSAEPDSCTRLTAATLMESVQAQEQAEETTVGPNGGFVKKMSDGTGTMVMCKGSSFPKTEKNDRNIEVLTAWRTITSNPQFKVGVLTRSMRRGLQTDRS